MPFRGFLAVEVGELPRLTEVQRELQATGGDVNLVDPGNVHVTLKFLGDTPEDRVPGIHEAMEEAVAGVAPRTLQLRGVGAFPSPDHLRVIWAGLADPAPVTRVAERLEALLEPLGFPREDRDFHAHATLARVKSGRAKTKLQRVLEDRRDDELGQLDWTRTVLMRSELTPSGPTYGVVDAVPLEG